MSQRIAFQGALGAYSHEAVLKARPDAVPVPCSAFEDVIRAVNTGARVVSSVRTRAGEVVYDGDTAIDGVPGSAAPIAKIANTRLPSRNR